MTVKKRPYNILAPISFDKVKIKDEFWSKKQEIIRNVSIHLQYDKLEKYRHIDNFRIAAKLKEGIFRGYFFFDSDLYKWLEASCFILKSHTDEALRRKVDEIVDLITGAQEKDGYINTYYSILFPERRFSNLLIMHELYCIGHLFQAAMAHQYLTGQDTLIKVASNCVGLLTEKFINEKIKGAPGHEEIELALIGLYRLTEEKKYLQIAEELINRRGNIKDYKSWAWQSFRNMLTTLKEAKNLTEEYENEHDESYTVNKYSPKLEFFHKAKGMVRFIREFLNGKYAQLDVPVRNAKEPVGHAVRAMYLYSAMADLYSETNDEKLLEALEKIWEKMVEARMYITGGTGSIGVLEGFGKDFELDNFNSYSETCAAIGNMMWNWRMLQITGNPKYADMVERLMYNAVLVGPSIDGKSYMYNNPLASKGKEERKEWFYVACCPPNIARTISSLGKYVYSVSDEGIWVHQYIGNEGKVELNDETIFLLMDSKLPWNPSINLKILQAPEKSFSLFLRVPSYMNNLALKINGKIHEKNILHNNYMELKESWKAGDLIEFEFQMEPEIIEPDPRLKINEGRIFIKHGPLIYCLEQKDNPEIDIFKTKVSKTPDLKVEFKPDLLGGINIIQGRTISNKKFTAIPYFTWLNRGPDKMIVWIKREK